MVLTDYPDEARDTWTSLSLCENEFGCKFVQCKNTDGTTRLKAASSSGYIQVQGIKIHKQEKAFAHRLCWGVAYGFETLPDQTSMPKREISHLCHEKTCCNILHLCLELAVVNKSRNYCWANEQTCFHFPRCLRPHPDLMAIKEKADRLQEERERTDAAVRTEMVILGITSMENFPSSAPDPEV